MIRFTKAHAYGNDFLYVREGDVTGGSHAVLARDMCDRHTGVGADGLILYAHTAGSPSASMVLFNADGSRAEVSGNGVRGLAALLLRDDVSTNAAIDIATAGGVKRMTRTEWSRSQQTFRAGMGIPVALAQGQVTVGTELVAVVTLNMGNPQCVVLGPLPDESRFLQIGRGLAEHSVFPDGTNVEFAHVERPDRVRILIWERGVGPTTSSGTGSCAALVAAAAHGGADREAEIVAPGGSQRVAWTDEGVFLTGWAKLVCDGEWLQQIPRTA